jgi:uncharacterized protein YuzE
MRMKMLRELKEIEGGDHAVYLRFTKLPVARTTSYANGEVMVDLDHYGEVIGIEVLSLDPAELAAVAEIATRYRLSFSKLTELAPRRKRTA